MIDISSANSQIYRFIIIWPRVLQRSDRWPRPRSQTHGWSPDLVVRQV